MRRHPLAVASFVLFLAMSFGALPIFARSARRATPPRTVTAVEWTWTAVWDAVKQFAWFLKNGSGIDPFGQPQATGSTSDPPPSTSGDNGSGIDPFGGK